MLNNCESSQSSAHHSHVIDVETFPHDRLFLQLLLKELERERNGEPTSTTATAESFLIYQGELTKDLVSRQLRIRHVASPVVNISF